MEQPNLPIVNAFRYVFMPSSRRAKQQGSEPPFVSSAVNTSDLSPQGQKFLRRHGLEGAPDTVFFVRKPLKLLLLMLVTLNIYGVYWFYKNWKAVSNVSSKKIFPFWRAIFNVFYAWPLFRLMMIQARLRGFEKSYSGGWLAIVYLFIGVPLSFAPRISNYKAQLIITYVIATFILWLVLHTIQRATTFNNEHLHTKAPGYSPRGTFEIVIVVIGGIMLALEATALAHIPNSQFGSSFFDQIKISSANARMRNLDAEYKRCTEYVNLVRPKVDQNNQAQVSVLENLSLQCSVIHQAQQQAADTYEQLIHAK